MKAEMRACTLSRFSRVWLFVTPWTVARQAPLSMGFSRQEYWSEWPCPPPRDLPDPGIEPRSPVSPALAGRFSSHWAAWEAPKDRDIYILLFLFLWRALDNTVHCIVSESVTGKIISNANYHNLQWNPKIAAHLCSCQNTMCSQMWTNFESP